MFFACSSSLKVCGGNFSGFWRPESVELHRFVASWSFWRFLGLISIHFKIKASSLDDSVSNILCIRMFKFLKFLEASGLNSNRTSVLLNLLWCCLWHGCLGVFQDLSQDVLVCRNAALGRFLFIGVWEKVSDTWRSLIGDTCHSLIGGFLRLFLQDTWHLLIGQNVLIFKVTHVRN